MSEYLAKDNLVRLIKFHYITFHYITFVLGITSNFEQTILQYTTCYVNTYVFNYNSIKFQHTIQRIILITYYILYYYIVRKQITIYVFTNTRIHPNIDRAQLICWHYCLKTRALNTRRIFVNCILWLYQPANLLKSRISKPLISVRIQDRSLRLIVLKTNVEDRKCI